MKRKKPPTFARYTGQAIKRWREQNGYRQEDVASAANRVGLPWRKTTVGAIEAGRRALSIEEFCLLPWTLNLTRWDHGHGYEGFIELRDFLPDDDMVELSSGGAESILLPGSLIKATLSSRLRDVFHVDVVQIPGGDATYYPTAERASRSDAARLKQLRSIFQKVWPGHQPDPSVINRIEQESRSGAVEKIARKLDVPPFAIAVAARRLWKTALETHREIQLFGRTEGKSQLQVQAMRAHATRKLTKEIEPLLSRVKGTPAARKRPPRATPPR